MQRKLLIVDTSGVMHSSKYSLGKTRLSHKKISTGIIYGFLLKLQAMTARIKPDITIFALDSKHSKRKKLYPGYKEGRVKESNEEEIRFNDIVYEQFNLITKSIIPDLGNRNNFRVSGKAGEYWCDNKDRLRRLCGRNYHKR
jgi:5'-3' exonuclease